VHTTRVPDASPAPLVCPVCKGDHILEFACKFGHMEIYGCRTCGATLSVPFTPSRPPPPRP